MKRFLDVTDRSRLLVGCCLLIVAAASHAAAPPGRYTVMPNTVRDNVTGLVWQRAVDANSYTQPGAANYCSNLSLDAWSNGWRLPTVKELQSIVDVRAYNPSIDATSFPSTPAAYFWSSSLYAETSGYALVVGFAYGNISSNNTSALYRVRCVR